MATVSHPGNVSPLSLALPAALCLVLAGLVTAQTGMFAPAPAQAPAFLPELVTIAPRRFEHRLDGEYYRSGFAVDAPEVVLSMDAPLQIMKYQVAAADYDTCVAQGACARREPGHEPDAVNGEAVPATGVSFDDASAYARWLSEKTGQTFTLPSDAEWAFAAGKAFVDDALGVDGDSRNPAIRWLADYNRETARKASTDPAPKPLGRQGINEYGIADLAGNVWEWTTTCQRRVDLDGAGAGRISDSCGIYVAEGKHRTPLTAFVRDPRTGGCSVGAPPDNLGFRLVRRPALGERMRRLIGLD